MKKLPWIVMGFLPASLGLIDWASDFSVIIIVAGVGSVFLCVFAAFGLLNGFVKNVWLQLLSAIFLGAGFVTVDAIIFVMIELALYPIRC